MDTDWDWRWVGLGALVLIAGLTGVGLAPTVAAQVDDPVTLEVSVVDQDDEPVAGATVTVRLRLSPV